MNRVLVAAPMAIEARALRRGAPRLRVARTGVGPRCARRAAAQLAAARGSGLAIAGVAGALADGLEPGDVVVASALLRRDGAPVLECSGAGLIAGMLRRRGVRAHVGPLVSVRAPVCGKARARLAATGAAAVDMESAWLGPGAAGRPLVVVRVVLDSAEREVWRPLATVGGFWRAARALESVAGAIAEWEAAIAARKLELAAPRAACAGVERAIEIVERALDRYGPPVYMRKQIVHNRHVVSELERRGAVCVEDLDEVPDGATVVFSAHGVSPAVREHARRKRLNVVDATCPLVSKVHAEARRFAEGGNTIVLIGHQGHEEIDGTAGEAPERVRVIAGEHEVDQLEVDDPGRIAYLTQTTLAVDETSDVVARLRDRFPAAVGPRSDDICYATQNRQDAVRTLAANCDVMLVIGSRNSSNSNRLVEVAERNGCRSYLIDDEAQIEPGWIAGAERIGVTAGASSPERIVQRIVRALTVLGPFEVSERTIATESMRFALPREVRG